ncbi:Polynucleotidyl transferase- ribonuclease H-like superfamily protein [Striga hermonthica]|uniref:Polynucleotidyl transferase- ribonuclease H-like superfamily protein n=1 Tax=Striga hermonthica TaxID=68872 RepID=A0A9N7RSR2_STRHE|nr:Polynucleotidyl transferase- ribonuclease H-like superfamily protein [Striga hermonthica]
MRALGKIWDTVQKGVRWSVGDGKQIKFWQDRWLHFDVTLLQVCTGVVPQPFINWTVSNYGTNDGQWRWNLFSHLLPANVLLRIAAVPPPGASSEPDLMYWGFLANGRFTTKSAYDSLSGDGTTTDSWLWRVIWKWVGPQRIRQFMWLVAKNCLMTNSERFRRHFVSSPTCELCGSAPETLLHTLRDCPKATQIWRTLIPGNMLPAFFSLDLVQWLGYNLCSVAANEMVEWSSFFGVTMWRIWNG